MILPLVSDKEDDITSKLTYRDFANNTENDPTAPETMA